MLGCVWEASDVDAFEALTNVLPGAGPAWSPTRPGDTSPSPAGYGV